MHSLSPSVRHYSIYPYLNFIFMIVANEWKCMVVPGKRYHVVAQFTDQDLEFTGIGAVGSERQDPVFMTTGLVTMMIPRGAIEKLEPVEQ
jgi:hypothetical protein